MAPDISVIIVNWNTRDLLLNCVRTAYETTKRQLEIIVVDNASTDGSLEALRQAFPEVRVIGNTTNTGFARANNIGIAASTGRYICLVNSDVEVLPECLDTLADCLDEHPGIGMVGPRVLNRDMTLQRSCTELPSLRNLLTQALMLDKLFPKSRYFRNRFMNDFDHQSSRDVEALSGCFLMCRREAIDTVGSLDEQFFIYHEDVDWCKRFRDAAWRVSFYPKAQAIHFGGASSAVAPTAFMIEMERANLQYWRKHHHRLTASLAGAISFIHYCVRVCAWTWAYILRPNADRSARTRIKNYMACLLWLTSFGSARARSRRPA